MLHGRHVALDDSIGHITDEQIGLGVAIREEGAMIFIHETPIGITAALTLLSGY